MYSLTAISDNPNICTGLGLVEVACQLVQDSNQLKHALDNLDPEAGLVVVTSGLAAKGADILAKFREKNSIPILAVIPDPEGA